VLRARIENQISTWLSQGAWDQVVATIPTQVHVILDHLRSRKAAVIVGLYLDPPDHAIVLAVDQKPAGRERSMYADRAGSGDDPDRRDAISG
jgi:hypothetical protein